MTATICLCAVPALGYQPMAATVRVSSGPLYDYVMVGENPNASDGFDNAYDTISPGNLNAEMGAAFVSAVIHHAEWKPALRDLRGDIRPPAERQEWQVTVTSSLDKGTLLALTLQPDRTNLPRGIRLRVQEQGAAKECDLAASACTISAPGPGKIRKFSIIADQKP